MKKNILMMGPILPQQMKMLDDAYTVHRLWQAKDPETFLGNIRNDIQGIVSVFGVNISAKLIQALPNLEIIAHCAVGYDNIDVAAAKERGVIVTNTPDVLTDDTADMAIGLMLAQMRRMIEGDVYVRSGLWSKRGDMPLGRSPRGRTMGVLGLGRIGLAIAKRAEVFGMKVVYNGPRQKDGVTYPYFSSLHDMAAASDVLMVSCVGGDRTRHLVDASVLKTLGKKGIVINIARGSVIREADLVDALENGVIAGAGLDVFAQEPDVPSALCRLDNVVLQPHQGSATLETRTAMAQLVVDNLALYFEKAEVLTPV